MNVLVIGSGGREHALCWTIRKSEKVKNLYCAPGNGGIAEAAECVSLASDTANDVIPFCRENGIDLVVVGPEAPLVAGLVDDLSAAGIRAFGPSKAAAQLEGSKGFTKDLCVKYGIPTAAYRRFTDAGKAKAYLKEKGAPVVIKADGLAAGKGVVIAETEREAEAAVDEMFAGRFGEAGKSLVLEEKLEGEEASFLAIVDGKTLLPLATSQDHKQAFDGDTGPNTGGMGAYSPAPVLDKEMSGRVMKEIMEPAVRAMAKEGHPYRGVLYAGLMITEDGPKLIEFNCRFGDPECQVVLARLASDLVPALTGSIEGTLETVELSWREQAALTVVIATKGYPGKYEKGSEIRNLKAAGRDENVEIFHAGTKRENGRIVAVGGRVLNVTALGRTVTEARERAYAAVNKIDWGQGFWRSDIGWRAVEREKK